MLQRRARILECAVANHWPVYPSFESALAAEFAAPSLSSTSVNPSAANNTNTSFPHGPSKQEGAEAGNNLDLDDTAFEMAHLRTVLLKLQTKLELRETELHNLTNALQRLPTRGTA